MGWANHAYFICFLLFAILGSFHGGLILSFSFYRGIFRYWYLVYGLDHLATVHFTMPTIIACILSMGFALGVVIALSMLLYFQVRIHGLASRSSFRDLLQSNGSLSLSLHRSNLLFEIKLV